MSDFLKLSSPAARQLWEIPVLHEDAELLALNKPSGLPTSPDWRNPGRPSLMELLRCDLRRGAAWVRQRQLGYLANAHRLDAETSGALLLAKTKAALVTMAKQFATPQPTRTFVALARGVPTEDAFSVAARLAPHPRRPGLLRVDPERGKPAVTEFTVRERFAGHALLVCRPRSDRLHQIRAHLQRCGLPLIGDSLYGGPPLLLSRLKRGYRFKADREERPLIGRAALHAEQLAVVHPATGLPLTIVAPWPKDLSVAVKYLRRFAPAGASPAFLAEKGGHLNARRPRLA